MARFVRGDVVVTPFPITVSEEFKRRPALVIASWPFRDTTDHLLCCITAQEPVDPEACELVDADFAEGSLRRRSFLRPTYLFAQHEGMMHYKVGSITNGKLTEVVRLIVRFIEHGS